MVQPISSLAVIGGGFMGAGIAETAAVVGIPVIVRELPEYLDGARQRIETSLARRVKRGKMDPAEHDEVLGRITMTSHLDAVADVELVIEAIPEVPELKMSLMKSLAGIVDHKTIIGSNTSSIPIAQLAGQVHNPGRVVGLHFFSPVPVMKLVEIVRAIDTSDDTVETMRAFIDKLGKHGIETKDRSGFVVNFLLVPYLMSAVRMYEDDFASREDIDDGMKLGAGHPMGPLALCDFIGLDVLLAVCNSLYDEFRRPEYAAPPLLRRMIASGRHGKKSGRGFYDYP